MGPGAFFGELYLRSTKPFLFDSLTDAEVQFLRPRLQPGRVLDLGCGHGRHARQLGPGAIGVDADALSLREASAFGPVVRGDLRALPFRPQAFRSAFAWYNSLGTFETPEVATILEGVARSLSPAGVLIVQGSNPAMARRRPEASYEGRLPDGSTLREACRWSFERRRDELERHLTLPEGRVMAASFFIRYYELQEWRALLEPAGFLVDWVCGGIDGSALLDDSMDVIVGAHKRG
jgi:SAM-dependent methyltransferase